MKKATLITDRYFIIGEVDSRIYGSFVEHLGRCVYEGIYQPGQKTADEQGFRRDVLALVNQLNVPVVRYPGGNFVSGYNWQDGVGPVKNRPARAELAWSVIETNEFGLDEFMDWCKKASTAPMMAVNLGTRGVEDAKNILEYCNFKGGTQYSDMRIKNGHKDPHNIKLWCLGNEMDGFWQMGHKTAYEYGRLASETGRVMKMLDPTIETVACGSSAWHLPWFGKWESEMLGECYDEVDYVSLHQYYNNTANNTAEFLANSVAMDNFISEVVSLCDAEKAKKNSKKKLHLSFDEWNVWYHSHDHDAALEKWGKAAHQLEDVYNFEDALLVGSMLITLLRHADRVKIACLAQLVNVIAPIMTSDTGAWKQTIFYPFAYTSQHGRGTVLNTIIKAPVYDTKNLGEVSVLDAVTVVNDEAETMTIFAVNKDLNEDLALDSDLRQYADYKVLSHVVLSHNDMKAVNTEAAPNTVAPRTNGNAIFANGILTATIEKHSWNMILLSKNS